jgi:hypothetical protein
MTTTTTTRNAPAGRRLGAALTILLFLTAGCNHLLEVDNPDAIEPGNLNGPLGLPALYAGAIGDFTLGYVGDAVTNAIEGQILVAGSFTDELGNSETFPTRKEYDQRTIDPKNSSLTDVFRNLMNSRRSAEKAAAALQEFSDDPTTDPRLAETLSLAGLDYVYLGENYCSGVPISDFNDQGDLEFGEPLTTTQLFDRAIERFESALQVQDGADMQYLAQVGKGRALLNLGQFAEAAAAVAGVPTEFEYDMTHTTSTGPQQNGVFVFMNENERFSVANLDGGNGLPFRDANDPRVPWFRDEGGEDVGFDNATPQYDEGKYGSETAPTTVANGVEARLIEAEAALQAGNTGGWLSILNTLRANTSLYPSALPPGFPKFPALGPLSDPGTPAARVDLMFRERAFWLYLTSHRLGDMRRLVRQYGRPAATVFPGGNGAPYVVNGNPKGGNFGTDVNLPVPFDETNNPKFQSCIDRNP